jgi:hypothetical protein
MNRGAWVLQIIHAFQSGPSPRAAILLLQPNGALAFHQLGGRHGYCAMLAKPINRCLNDNSSDANSAFSVSNYYMSREELLMLSRRRFLKYVMGAGLGAVTIPQLRYARSAQDNDTVFLMSYFQREAEALHLAYSLDGYSWQALNNNEPVFKSTVGTLSMRDPFIRPDQDGIFRMLWTDGWESPQIGYSYSFDLINWNEPQLIPMMTEVEHARNCWAPEYFYDHEAAVYRLIWATTVQADGGWDHRIWSSVTEDFETFSPPELYFDPGYRVIDATMVYDAGRYVMAFKDERGSEEPSRIYKAIRTAEAASGAGPFEDISETMSFEYTEGPTIFRVGDDWIMFCDMYQDKQFSASISSDLREWRDITDKVQFPEHPRHATVFSANRDILRLLLEQYS